jgi:hypothetical protein
MASQTPIDAAQSSSWCAPNSIPPDVFKNTFKVQYKNHNKYCRNITHYSDSSFHSHIVSQISGGSVAFHARVVVGKGVKEAVAELEFDHTGYVVCQRPSSYVDDIGEDVAVIVVEADVEFDGLAKVRAVTDEVATAEAYSVVVGEMTVTVCCPAAVIVTVAAAGVIVTT